MTLSLNSQQLLFDQCYLQPFVAKVNQGCHSRTASFMQEPGILTQSKEHFSCLSANTHPHVCAEKSMKLLPTESALKFQESRRAAAAVWEESRVQWLLHDLHLQECSPWHKSVGLIACTVLQEPGTAVYRQLYAHHNMDCLCQLQHFGSWQEVLGYAPFYCFLSDSRYHTQPCWLHLIFHCLSFYIV